MSLPPAAVLMAHAGFVLLSFPSPTLDTHDTKARHTFEVLWSRRGSVPSVSHHRE